MNQNKKLYSILDHWQSLGLVILLYFYYIKSIFNDVFNEFYSELFFLYPFLFGLVVFFRNGLRFSKSGLPVLVLYGFLFFIMTISSFFVDDQSASFIYIGRYFYASVFLGFITLSIITKNKLNIDIILFWFLVFASLIVSYAILTNGEFQGRLTINGSNPIYFSLLCAMACCIALAKCIEACFFKENIIYLFFFVIAFYGLISSGGRGALLSFFVTMFFYFLFRTVVLFLRGRFPIFLCVSVITLPVFFLLASDYFLSHSSRSFHGLYKLLNGEIDSSGSIRLELAKFWLNNFYDSPILGVGAGSLDGYPHNIFIELVTLTGVLGLLFFILLSVIIAYCFFMSQFLNDTSIRALSLMVACAFLNSMFSFSFNMLSHLFILVLVLFVFCRNYKYHGGANA